jgi:hypothetical protein
VGAITVVGSANENHTSKDERKTFGCAITFCDYMLSCAEAKRARAFALVTGGLGVTKKGRVKTGNIIADMRTLQPKGASGAGGSPQSVSGMNFPVVKLVEIFSFDDWEGFTEEWATCLVPGYHQVLRFSGAGDKGCDVVGFVSDKFFDGPWDNYQCKHYGAKLTPSDIWVELGKIIYYSHIGEYTAPRRCFFVAPKDIGLKLKKLFTKPAELRSGLAEQWETHCKTGITTTQEIPLEGVLKTYFDAFDFTIFRSMSVVEMIRGHSKTPFFASRFGNAGLPERPTPQQPPPTVQPKESRYVQHLLRAYSEHLNQPMTDPKDLANWPVLERHFNRCREVFYHAESLRSFAQDSVDAGMFEAVRDEIYHGVVDTCDLEYPDGLARVRATMTQAGNLNPKCNALCLRVYVQDKHGICHHLANIDRLVWARRNGNG